MRRLLLVILAALLWAAPCLAQDKVRHVSVTQIVEHPSLDAMRLGFLDRLKALGLKVEPSVHIAQGNMATNVQIASQVQGENPDLILAITTPSAQAVVQKIKDKPIVFTGVTDPLAAGLVKSLSAPGGNVTGMTDMSPMDRHVALIKECVPGIKRLGVLYNAGEPNSVVLVNLLKNECAKAGVALEEATAANSAAVYQAAKSLVGRVDAVYVPVDNTVVSALEGAIKVCEQNRLPFFSGDTDSVARGTVAALAVDYRKMGEQTADMAAAILKDGKKPGEMPVETIRDLALHVNKGAAARMGLTLPESVLKRADKIIP
ncbi:ABC transporter substrate-binding protein [Desulfovibrio sp.]